MDSSLKTNAQFFQIVHSQFIQTSDVQKTYEFMVRFFQNFVITEGKPNNFDFKRCLDTVNDMILEPPKKFYDQESISKADMNKLEIWNEAHSKFETTLQLELLNIGKGMEKGSVLYELLH